MKRVGETRQEELDKIKKLSYNRAWTYFVIYCLPVWTVVLVCFCFSSLARFCVPSSGVIPSPTTDTYQKKIELPSVFCMLIVFGWVTRLKGRGGVFDC